MQTSPSGKASASQYFCWHVPLTSLANQLSKQPHARGLFSIHAPSVGWGRGDKGIDGSAQRMRPGGDDRMRRTRSNGRVVEIRGVDGNVDACGLEGGGDRMRRTRSGGRVVIRFG